MRLNLLHKNATTVGLICPPLNNLYPSGQLQYPKAVQSSGVNKLNYVKKTWVVFLGLGCIYTAQAQDANISMNYRGQPVPSAISPSMSAFSQDVCGIPVSGAISSTVIGFSGGSVYTDTNCERIKLAKTLNDLGLKVAAVATLCQDDRIWDAMMMSGTPCPIDGLIGDAARNEWIKQKPKKFERLYGQVPPIISVTVQSSESK